MPHLRNADAHRLVISLKAVFRADMTESDQINARAAGFFDMHVSSASGLSLGPGTAHEEHYQSQFPSLKILVAKTIGQLMLSDSVPSSSGASVYDFAKINVLLLLLTLN